MDNRLDALDVALSNETSEREFYLAHARKTGNPLGKEMFLMIADDELEHYERLKDLHEKLKDRKMWPESVPLSVKQTKVRSLIDALNSAPDAGQTSEDDLEALRVAAEFEAKGVDFYARLRDESTDPREKAFFAMLSGIEREHYLALKDAEEYLKDPEGWLRRTERGSLDG
ncbi:MAG TPA: ferritin family protein [Deltaproteobacteria bacterium]|jgi:rubrerythrin|nr:ferritin family protein [Deltaproteobacteria bacterium]HOI07359.1 ferritin family protein [Deltaproteobacteria bacterium]